MKRNKHTEMLALRALDQLERWSQHGIDGYLEEHGGILLPAEMQVDRAVATIKGFLDAEIEKDDLDLYIEERDTKAPGFADAVAAVEHRKKKDNE